MKADRMNSFQPPGTPATVLAAEVDQLGLTTPQHRTLPRPNLPHTPTPRRVVHRPAARREYRIPAALMRMIEQGLPAGPPPLVPNGNGTVTAAAPIPLPLPTVRPPPPTILPPTLLSPPPTIPPPPPTAMPPPQTPGMAADSPCNARCYECGSATHKFYQCPRLDRSRVRRGAICKPWRDTRGRRGGGRGGGRGSRGTLVSKPEGQGQGGQTIVYNFQHYF